MDFAGLPDTHNAGFSTVGCAMRRVLQRASLALTIHGSAASSLALATVGGRFRFNVVGASVGKDRPRTGVVIQTLGPKMLLVSVHRYFVSRALESRRKDCHDSPPEASGVVDGSGAGLIALQLPRRRLPGGFCSRSCSAVLAAGRPGTTSTRSWLATASTDPRHLGGAVAATR